MMLEFSIIIIRRLNIYHLTLDLYDLFNGSSKSIVHHFSPKFSSTRYGDW